jgi:hypothetical protein
MIANYLLSEIVIGLYMVQARSSEVHTRDTGESEKLEAQCENNESRKQSLGPGDNNS